MSKGRWTVLIIGLVAAAIVALGSSDSTFVIVAVIGAAALTGTLIAAIGAGRDHDSIWTRSDKPTSRSEAQRRRQQEDEALEQSRYQGRGVGSALKNQPRIKP